MKIKYPFRTLYIVGVFLLSMGLGLQEDYTLFLVSFGLSLTIMSIVLGFRYFDNIIQNQSNTLNEQYNKVHILEDQLSSPPPED